jgi:hypothetical protein
MKFQYKLSLLFILLSQTSFLLIAAYHTDNQIYYSSAGSTDEISTGYSWIWYHLEHWIISLFLAFAGLASFSHGAISDFRAKKQKKPTHDVQDKSTPNRKRIIYIILLIAVWSIVIVLSLYFAGLFNSS